jgi:alanine racemase
VLSGFWPNEENEIVRHRLTPTVWNQTQLDSLENAAGAASAKLAIHLKVNTGMNRLGANMKDLPAILSKIAASRHLSLEGIFNHFAASEVLGDNDGDEQLRRFDQACEVATKAGLNPTIRHMANSAAIVSRPSSWFNMVRPGLAIYGYSLPLTSAGSAYAPTPLSLKPALTWKTRVLQMRDVAAGQHVGYSAGHITKSQTRVAVLPVGYGDGLSRRLSSRGRVIIHGMYAPIIGNVSMNLTTVDVTAIPAVTTGDEVIVIGEDGACRISAEDHATWAGTIPYEILCNISARLPRIYRSSEKA